MSNLIWLGLSQVALAFGIAGIVFGLAERRRRKRMLEAFGTLLDNLAASESERLHLLSDRIKDRYSISETEAERVGAALFAAEKSFFGSLVKSLLTGDTDALASLHREMARCQETQMGVIGELLQDSAPVADTEEAAERAETPSVDSFQVNVSEASSIEIPKDIPELGDGEPEATAESVEGGNPEVEAELSEEGEPRPEGSAEPAAEAVSDEPEVAESVEDGDELVILPRTPVSEPDPVNDAESAPDAGTQETEPDISMADAAEAEVVPAAEPEPEPSEPDSLESSEDADELVILPRTLAAETISEEKTDLPAPEAIKSEE